MANGDCPVGAENKANIRNLGRTCDELRACMTKLEEKIDTLTEGQTDMRIADAWDWRKIVLALVALLLTSGGGNLLADMLKISGQ